MNRWKFRSSEAVDRRRYLPEGVDLRCSSWSLSYQYRSSSLSAGADRLRYRSLSLSEAADRLLRLHLSFPFSFVS
jgi:hypothetical protein